MRYQTYKEWLLLEISEEYHLKTVGEFLDSFHVGQKEEWIRNGIRLNRNPVEESTILLQGDTLQIRAFPPQEVDFASDEEPAEVVYEDEFLLIANKPAGIIMYPESKEGNGTLANRVARYYRDRGIRCAVRPVHRLDRDTSGLVMFSKSPFLQPQLDYMMAKHQIHRYYYAFVEGRIREDGTVDAPIARDRHDAKKMRVDFRNGKRAVTHYRVVRSVRGFTLLECVLETGRTHQIRVHMKYIRHPIVNDALYGEPYDRLPFGLQAFRIRFAHPVTGRMVQAEVPCAF